MRAACSAPSMKTTAVDLLTRRMTASVNLVKALGGGWRASDLACADAASGPGVGGAVAFGG